MQQANLEGTRSAAARSWLKWEGGIHLGSKPAIGSIAVFPRDHNPAQGHVAFVWMVRSDGSIDVLGGNQGGKSATAKTAGTSSHVSIGHHKKGHALDFLWPKSLPLPIAGSDSFIRLKSRSVPRDLKPADYGWEQPGTPMQDGIISRVIIA